MNPIPDHLDEAAARWSVRHDSGLTPAEQGEFQRWLAADPRHAAVWSEHVHASGVLTAVRSEGTADSFVRELTARRSRRRFRTLTVATSLGLAACTASLFFILQPSATPVPQVASTGQAILSRPQHRTLEDGTVIELNRDAQIEVDYQPATRRVRLLRGEALFAVAKNPDRPFIVSAAGVEVRAVGTAFSVRYDTAQVDVLVTEGRVAVDHPTDSNVSAPGTPTFLNAGERARVALESVTSSPAVETVTAPELERRLAWRGPRLELSGTPLAEAVVLLNQENQLQLALDDPSLATMTLSGIFRADNAEGFVRLLEANYGIQAERTGDRVVLRKAP